MNDKMTLDEFNLLVASRSEKINKRNQISSRFYRLNENNYYDLKEISVKKLAPDLMILGAQKSGTTSLYYYLDQHPEIFMTKPLKESGFYRNEKQMISYWQKKDIKIKNRYSLLSDYMLQGYQGEAYIGDASTFYTNQNFNENLEISNTIKIFERKPKFIYIVRNPFHRLVSNYLHTKQRNYSDKNFKDWITGDGKKNILTSMYNYQLKKYFKVFPQDNFQIIIYDKLISSPETVIKTCEKFLSLKNYNGYKFKAYNQSKISIDNQTKHQLWKDSALNKIIDELITDLKEFEKTTSIKLPNSFFSTSY